jgi:hypothetical protein
MPGSIFLTGRLSIPQLIRPPWASALRLGVKSIHLIDPGHGRPAKQIHDWMIRCLFLLDLDVPAVLIIIK